jgi:hypothetical protein
MQASSTNRENTSARLIVCEKTGRWAAQLRRLLQGEGRWLAEARSPTQWLDALAEHPASLCLVEATASNFEQFHAALTRSREEFPLARTVIASDELPADAMWALREAGAIHAVDALRRLDRVVALWRRQMEQFPPRAETELDRVHAALPWSE